jgi:hypothetical protein
MLFQPGDLLIDHLLNLGLLLLAQLPAQLLLVADLVLQAVGIALQLIPRLHARLQLRVLVGKLLRVVDHPLNVLRGQPVLIVRDRDLLLVAGALVLRRHLKERKKERSFIFSTTAHTDKRHSSCIIQNYVTYIRQKSWLKVPSHQIRLA